MKAIWIQLKRYWDEYGGTALFFLLIANLAVFTFLLVRQYKVTDDVRAIYERDRDERQELERELRQTIDVATKQNVMLRILLSKQEPGHQQQPDSVAPLSHAP